MGAATTCTCRGATPTRKPRKPARVVYTRKCPEKFGDGSGGGDGGSGGSGGGSNSGGVNPRKCGGLTPAEKAQLAPVVPELHEHDH